MQLLSVILLLFCASISFAGVHRMSLHKVVKTGTLKSYRANRAMARMRLNMRQGNIFTTDHKTGVEDELGDNAYVANITIGTPPQVFQVAMDTVSADLYIADSTCLRTDCDGCETSCHRFGCCCDCCGPMNCRARQFVSPGSSSYVRNGKKFQLTDKYAQFSGFLGTDVVNLGTGEDALSVPGVTFGQATQMPWYSAIDGKLGLAFASIADDGFTTPFVQAINLGLVNKPVYSVFISRENYPGTPQDGVFTFGDLDSENCGDAIGYLTLTSATYFQFHLDKIEIAGYSNSKGWDAIIDLSNDFIPAPRKVVEDIAAQLFPGDTDDTSLFPVDCNAQFAELQLSFGGLQLSVKAEDMIVEWTPGDCYFALEPTDSTGFGPEVTLGAPFFRQYCNIFDIGNKRVGFANHK